MGCAATEDVSPTDPRGSGASFKDCHFDSDGHGTPRRRPPLVAWRLRRTHVGPGARTRCGAPSGGWAGVGCRVGCRGAERVALRVVTRGDRRVEVAPRGSPRAKRVSISSAEANRTRIPATAARCCASCGGLAPHRGLRLPAVAHQSWLVIPKSPGISKPDCATARLGHHGSLSFRSSPRAHAPAPS